MRVALFVRFGFWLWFATALAVGHFHLLHRIQPLATIGIVATLTAGLLLAYFRITPLRAWLAGLDLRTLVLLHVARFVGIYYLVLYQRGDLPRAFAVPAGIGDIVIATMALPVALAPIEPFARLRAILIWNVVGLVNLLLVLFTVTRIFLTEPASLHPFLNLPLSLVPTFLVPLLLATHVVILARCVQERPPRPSP